MNEDKEDYVRKLWLFARIMKRKIESGKSEDENTLNRFLDTAETISSLSGLKTEYIIVLLDTTKTFKEFLFKLEEIE